MGLFVRILGTLLLAAVILANCAASATGSTSKLERDYGDAAAAISSREAGELLLQLVNAERAKLGTHGWSQLKLSASASKLARQHADDMAAHGYVGHYDLEGRKCELRYNLLGETDHVAENIAYREVGARVRLTPQLVRSIFQDWISSDSHRDNIHHWAHTHMGYGFATQTTGQVTKIYAVQEFVNKWGDFSTLPATVKPGESLTLSGTLSQDATFYRVGLGWETPPGARNPQDVGERDLHYKQPQVQHSYLGKFSSKEWREGPAPLYPPPYPEWFPDAVTENPDGSFIAPFEVPHVVKPTDLYVTVWARPKAVKAADSSGLLFRAMTQVIRVKPSI